MNPFPYPYWRGRTRRAAGIAACCAAVLVPATLQAAPPRPEVTAAEFHQAIRDRDLGFIQDVLVNGDPSLANATVGRGVAPLHLAAVLNLGEITEVLLTHGADPNVRSDDGFTPLHWAASRDSAAAAEVLIRHGADVNAATTRGITPLHWAANRNATNVVVILLAAGANTDAVTDNDAKPIHWAHLNEHEDAALLIADSIVTRELESERTNVVLQAELPEPPATSTDATLPTPLPLDTTDIYITRKGEQEGQALIVNIGLGETLVFEWIKPLHIWAGKYEVSNGQYRRFSPSHTSRFREKYTLDANDQPVVFVSWADAQEYCEWLNRTYQDRLPKGFRFRLPFALEWTLLARCGENRTYPWGNAWPPAYGNFSDLTAREHLSEWHGIPHYDDGQVVTCPVAKSGMNEWGLYGMAGNVWEWCEDWYSSERRYRVRRGGSWDFDGEPNVRINAIGFDRPEVRDDTIGFRIVASMTK